MDGNIKNEEQTKRGWGWTEEERCSVKALKRKLEKQFKFVESMVNGLPNALPEFASNAEIYGNPYLESAKEILSLDSRRKGKKWQHISFASLPKKMSKIAELYLEYQECFLSQKDFQSALNDYNSGVQKKNKEVKNLEKEAIEKLISNNLNYLEEIKTNKQLLDNEIKTNQDFLHMGALIKLKDISNFSDDETNFLHDWVTIQFIDIASRQNAEVLKHVSEQISIIEKPIELLHDVYLLLIEHQILTSNQRIEKGFLFFNPMTPTEMIEGIYSLILNTILYRLNKIISLNPSILPSQLTFSLFDRTFEN